jgi:cell division septation protein DedD
LDEVAAGRLARDAMDMAACRGIAGMLAGAILAALCAPARAETPATFPTTVDRAGLMAWLKQATDIAPGQVLAVSPSAVTAVLGTIETTAPDGVRMALRAEAIDPTVSDREGALSWHMLVEVDCPGHKVRQGPTTGYAGRNLLGEGRQIRPGSEAWVAPPPGSQLENVWRAACEAGFQRPLAPPRSFSIAQAAMPAAARTPAAATTPPLALRPMLATGVHSSAPVAVTAPKAAPPTQPPLTAPRPNAAPTFRAMSAVTETPGAHSVLAVQLGAMATRAAAEALLTELKARSLVAMHGLSTGVTPATVGGRTLYRALVTGFSRDTDANRFCAGLKASGIACFVR